MSKICIYRIHINFNKLQTWFSHLACHKYFYLLKNLKNYYNPTMSAWQSWSYSCSWIGCAALALLLSIKGRLRNPHKIAFNLALLHKSAWIPKSPCISLPMRGGPMSFPVSGFPLRTATSHRWLECSWLTGQRGVRIPTSKNSLRLLRKW